MLNLHRVSWRQAVMVAQGTGAVQSLEPLPFIFFDAVAHSEEEAREQKFAANSERAFEKAKRESGWTR